jgi:hypothetical protein
VFKTLLRQLEAMAHLYDGFVFLSSEQGNIIRASGVLRRATPEGELGFITAMQ